MDFKVQVKLKNSYWREVHVQSGETSVVFGSPTQKKQTERALNGTL